MAYVFKTLPGLNVRFPWSQLLISGKKTVETRGYPIPPLLINVPLAIVETPGKDLKIRSRVVGVIWFGQSYRYSSEDDYYAETGKHLVTSSDPDFAWTSSTECRWGWPVKTCIQASWELPLQLRKGIVYSKAIPIPPHILSGDLSDLTV